MAGGRRNPFRCVCVLQSKKTICVTITYICCSCPDDLPQPAALSLHIRSLRELRQAKTRAGLAKHMNSSYIQINNLGLMEVCEIRPWVGKVVDGLRKIEGENAGAIRKRQQGEPGGYARGFNDMDEDEDGY